MRNVLILFVCGVLLCGGGVYLFFTRDTCDGIAEHSDIFVVTAFLPETQAVFSVSEVGDSCMSGRIRYTMLRIGGVEVVQYESGVGPTRAHETTSHTLARFPVETLIFAGVAGGILGKTVALGDTVVAERWVDMESGDSVAVDSVLLEHMRMMSEVAVVPFGGMAHAFVTDPADLVEGVSLVSMETYRIAILAHTQRVPFIDIRTISDMVGENEGTREYTSAAMTSARVLETYLQQFHTGGE